VACDLVEVAAASVAQHSTAQHSSEHGVDALSLHMGVADRATVDAVIAVVQARYGRIDVLVINAGITRDARLQRIRT
jgi:3-oxoacyl-[acyl-carrier protein] reductase